MLHKNSMSAAQQNNNPFQRRPPLWLYYELAPHQWKRPEYLNLCLETVQKHCGRPFRVVSLTRYDIYKYVPDLREDIWHVCSHQQRMDVMKWELLSRYGGLFLDAGVLVVRDLTPYLNQLLYHDFVAFGQELSLTPPNLPNSKLNLNHPHKQPVWPLTWAMASRPRGQLVTLARQRSYWLIDNKLSTVLSKDDLDTDHHHIFGKAMLWECMTILQRHSTPERSWKYFHVDAQCVGSDAHNQPYTQDRFMTNESIDERCVQSVHLVPLHPNSAPHSFPSWFVDASREKLLGNSQLLVGKLWRWALLDETPFKDPHVARTMPAASIPRFWVSGWVS